MSNPLVSIIIPCYRQAHFLGEAIQSALNQAYRPIEVIVLNDGSDDDTEAVARGFGGKIKYHWQPNSGLPAARNAGISRATGKYILCLDSDDLLGPEAVKWLVDAAEDREDVLCTMGFKMFKTDPSKDGYDAQLPPVEEPLAPKLMIENFGPPHSYMYSRSMLTAIGGFHIDAKLHGNEDWNCWLRLVFAGARIVPISQVGAFYRWHSNSMCRTRGVRIFAAEAETLWRTYRWTVANRSQSVRMGVEPRVLHQEIARGLYRRARRIHKGGRYLAALRVYWRSARPGGLYNPLLSGVLRLPMQMAMRTFNPTFRATRH